jgi:nucleoside-diphosphate-sugar epimerase
MGNKSLVIGNTSQLSYYFPKNYEKISSRNIDVEKIRLGGYDSVYILFAEQRTFLNETEKFFNDVNVTTTLNLIDSIKDFVKRVIIYSTSELWNNCQGKVFVSDDYNYNYTPYIKSKEILCNCINEKKEFYNNVHIIYPFNFNTPYRKSGFLFSKVFDSLLNKNINLIGDINFERDLIHPINIINESIITHSDKLIGCGELINVENFVFDLFNIHNINYKDYLVKNDNQNLTNTRKGYLSGVSYSNYNELLNLTNKDIYEYKIS